MNITKKGQNFNRTPECDTPMLLSWDIDSCLYQLFRSQPFLLLIKIDFPSLENEFIGHIFFISFTYRYVVFQIAGGLVRTIRDPEFNVCIPYSTCFVQSEFLFYNLPFFDHLFLLQIQCNIDTCWTSKTGSVAITMMTSSAETAVIASACLK